MNLTDYDYLYSLARTSIEHGLLHGAALFLNPRYIDPIYLTRECTFVSLKMDDTNIGCIGNTEPMIFYHSILVNSFQSAFKDSRFPPINKNNIKKIYIQIHHLKDNVRTVKVNNMQELVSQISQTDSLQMIYRDSKPIMLSIMQKEYKTTDVFVTETMKKGNIPINNVWPDITIRLIPTVPLEIKKLSEIQLCQNYI